jgi:hypothetical protein
MDISGLELRLGMPVVGSDGQHVGRVKEIRATDFLVDRRFRRNVYVPFAAIQRIISQEEPATLYVALDMIATRADRIGWPQLRQLARLPI